MVEPKEPNEPYTNHGVLRRIHIDKGTNFMSNEVKTICYTDGIELVKTLVTDHRANGCVERTTGRLKNSILTYAKEKNPVLLGNMLERALGALLFSVNATAKLTTFQAHHGCEAISFLKNFTKNCRFNI